MKTSTSGSITSLQTKKIKYMKERLKMIFDRIDIFVVCIVFWLCITVAEAYIGFWKGFAQCFLMTFLIAEVCYTTRCNDKLKNELIETNEKLKDAKEALEKANNELYASNHKDATRRLDEIKYHSLFAKLWRARWKCEHAKVNYCKYKITSEELVDTLNRTESEINVISEMIDALEGELG